MRNEVGVDFAYAWLGVIKIAQYQYLGNYFQNTVKKHIAQNSVIWRIYLCAKTATIVGNTYGNDEVNGIHSPVPRVCVVVSCCRHERYTTGSIVIFRVRRQFADDIAGNNTGPPPSESRINLLCLRLCIVCLWQQLHFLFCVRIMCIFVYTMWAIWYLHNTHIHF